MKRRIIAFVCLVTMLVSMMAITVPAAATDNADRFVVGYSKKDITPWVQSSYTNGLGIADTTYTDNHIVNIDIYDPASASTVSQKMVSVPLAGYGSSDTRVSLKLADDNGDGYIGLGDGVFTTCTSVTDSYGTTVLYVTLDAVGAYDHIVSAAKTKIASAICDLGGSISGDRIMICTSHSHSAPDMDWIYSNASAGQAWKAYYDYYVNQMVEAAKEAYSTATEAAMTKGEVSAKTATAARGENGGDGYQMNSVRHYYRKNGYGGNKAFIGSNEFNNIHQNVYNAKGESVVYNSGTVTSSVVAESNDKVYVLQFTPENAKEAPILLVNWRAHPGFAGANDKSILSADYINALRQGLEDEGYRVGFYQGASGNINPTSLFHSDAMKQAYPGFSSMSDIQQATTYGGLLADVVRYCLDYCMTSELEAGEIRTRQIVYHPEREYVDGTLNLQLNAIALGKYVTFVSAPGELFDRYDANYATNYQAVTYKKYTEKWFGLSYDMVTTKVDIKNPPVIESNDGPIDYTAYTTNEWDNLVDETYGTPFVLGYTNARGGYFPNTMAYDYNDNLTNPSITLTDGSKLAFQTHSYEANGEGVIAQGEGENIIKKFGEILSVVTSEDRREAKCEHCGEPVYWEPLTKENADQRTLGTGHYYLVEDITGVSAQTKTIQGTVCLDLNGKTLATDHSKNGNAFLLAKNAVLNIMDSGKTGTIIGYGASGYTAGGVISLQYGYYSTLNLYGGTLKLADNSNVSATKGAVIAVNDSCTFNMYGGTIEGGTAEYGGSLYVYEDNGHGGGNVYISGGTIKAGAASVVGDCVYLPSGSAKVYLSGTAVVDEIYCNVVSNTNLIYEVNVDGAFAGSAKLAFSDTFSVREGSIVGNGTNSPSIGDTSITCTDSSGNIYYGAISGDKVILTRNLPFVIMGVDGNNNHTMSRSNATFAEALAAYSAGSTDPEQVTCYIKLRKDVTENVTIGKDVYIDLNGYSITGQVTVNAGSTLYCMDSQTNDYDVEDGNGYGKITKTVLGDERVKGVPVNCGISPVEVRNEADPTPYKAGYLMVEKEGAISFHRVDLDITHVVLAPEIAGISYSCPFSGDQVVKEEVQTFGVALSLVDYPNAQNLETDCRYSWFTEFESGKGVNVVRSSKLTGILKEENTYIANAQNSNCYIYGSAYILTDDGYVFGSQKQVTLRQVVEYADMTFSESTGDPLRTNTIEMYQKYASLLNGWNIDNIKRVAAATK